MAHFAQLDENNVVVNVIVVANQDISDENGNEVESIGVAFCQNLFGGRWVQTSYNGKFRKRYASIGSTYNEALDAFVLPQRYPSWVLDSQTANWVAPIPKPNNGKVYDWNEDTLSWVEVLPQQ